MAQYYTVVYGTFGDFDARVSALIAEGWSLAGGPYAQGSYMAQALYRLPKITITVTPMESFDVQS
jgi:hypothetical protein